MGFINSIEGGWISVVAAALVAIFAYPFYNVVYNLYFHPLAKFPGPKFWAASRIPYISAMFSGTLVKKELEFHKRYGQMVRIGPDEISITTPDAWDDMHANRPGHQIPGKHPLWYQTAGGQADNIILTKSPKDHARMRNLLKSSFSESTLRTQIPMVESYANLFINRLRTLASKGGAKGASINIVDWFTFFTTDIVGDLALGESFNCLYDGKYNPWVGNLYKFFEGMNMAVATRFYPWLDRVVQAMLPKSILEAVRQHGEFVNQRIEKRLNLETNRPDFMTAFMKDNQGFENMSLDELQSNFGLIIVAGSETTATTLAGVLNYITRPEYSPIMEKLLKEVRGTYQREEEITVDSTSKLTYLIATLNEGLRLCNPIPGGLYRQTPPEGTVISGSYVPGGTAVAIRNFCVARDPETFAEPDRFAPERWLTGADKPKKYAQDKLSASQPFSVGSYNCLGKPLAWAELRIILARFLWAFDVSVDKGDAWEWDEQEMLVMVHKKPFQVRIKDRKGVEIKA